MHIGKIAIGLLAVAAMAASADANALTRKKELTNKENFTVEDAAKGQVFVDAAMTTPMMTLLSKADVNHPELMLEYGLALDLGRPSVSSAMSKDDKDKLKRGFRAMLDLYINKSDKFDITFNEDAMLDQSEFWIYLAKHVGRPKEHVDASSVVNMSQGAPGSVDTSMNMFLADSSDQDKEFNLNQDLILKPNLVNASTACAQSAYGFARMRKAQTVDIAETKLTAEQFVTVQAMAVKNYRLAWSEGQIACASTDYFNKVVAFASQNLGALGAMKDNPAAVVATLNSSEPNTDSPVPGN